MIINRKKLNKKWCKYEGKVELLIRPFKFSKFKLEDVAKGLLEKYMFCLMDWKGITEEDGKTEFKCNTENKKLIYDHMDKVREFVFAKISEYQEDMEKSIKN